MQKILEAFANDALRVEADVGQRSMEHQKACDLDVELERQLEERLEEEDRQLLEKLMEAVSIESHYYAQERFIRGYRLGALMMLEVFSDPDIFVWKDIDRVK